MKTDPLTSFRGGTTVTQKMLFICCSVNAAIRNMWAALKPNSGRGLMFTIFFCSSKRINNKFYILLYLSNYSKTPQFTVYSLHVCKSYFRSYARKHNEGTLERGKLIPQANFFSNFFETNHRGKFDVTIKIIDGAENVFSLRRKELFWQYRLGTFLPRGLNERAADVELDMFACGIA